MPITEITFPLIFHNGHLLFRHRETTALLDTGAPRSVASGNSIHFINGRFETEPNYHGLSLRELESFIGTSVDMIIGSDILTKFDFMIDMQKGIITFGAAIKNNTIAVPVTFFLNIPVIRCRLNGVDTIAFLDTGAKLSYIDPEITVGLEAIGTSLDYYPMLGPFQTRIYKATFCADAATAELTCGILPDILRFTFEMTDINNIIGTEIYRFHTVYFSLSRKFVFFSPNNDAV